MERNFLQQLQTWKKSSDRKPLVLKGTRQVGKTYILRMFGEHFFPSFHYINFEEQNKFGKIFQSDYDPRRILQELQFLLDCPIDVKHDLLIFDEIQECPKALTSLKYFCEEVPELALCAAGSLLGIQIGTASFPVGKVDFLNLFPLSFSEFLKGTGENSVVEILQDLTFGKQLPEVVHDRLWRLFKEYLVTGGLPEVVKTYATGKKDLFKAFNAVRKKQKDLLLGYFADIAKHSGKQNSMQIERLWRNIPVQLAKELDGSTPKFQFKNVIPGIKGYSKLVGAIDWLIAAGLAIKVPIIHNGKLPFSAYAEENRFKLYFFDIGLLGAVSGLPVQTILDYQFGSYKGYIVENFVAQQFLASGVDELYCWKGRTSEVEFLIEKQGEVIPVEVKSGRIRQAKSLNFFCERYNSVYATILSGSNHRIDSDRKRHYYPLYMASDFLKNNH